jgi:hypothetical protein
MVCPLLPLPLDLSHLRHQVAQLVAIEFGDWGDTMDVPKKVFRCSEERFERSLAISATE